MQLRDHRVFCQAGERGRHQAHRVVQGGSMGIRRIVAGIAVFLLALAAGAQEFPTHPVTLVVPFSAGGTTDTIARILAPRMTRSLGPDVAVENTTGAGGTIAGSGIARAPSP